MSVTQRDFARDDTRHTSHRFQTNPVRSAHSGDESSALGACQQRLEATLRRNDELLEIQSSLTKRVSSLEFALVTANQFAHYDELTGLPNRRLLLDRFKQAAALANRHRQLLALLFFDVNDFKRANDKLGHDAGDKLLQQVATRLASSIRRSDTACRYGGDEFIVLLTEIADREHLVSALKKIRTELVAPYEIDRHCIRLTVSDGMAIYPRDGQRFTDLMQLSDRSMFNNKPGNRRQADGVSEMSIWLRDTGKVSRVSQ